VWVSYRGSTSSGRVLPKDRNDQAAISRLHTELQKRIGQAMKDIAYLEVDL
jgi:hypothetical protein